MGSFLPHLQTLIKVKLFFHSSWFFPSLIMFSKTPQLCSWCLSFLLDAAPPPTPEEHAALPPFIFPYFCLSLVNIPWDLPPLQPPPDHCYALLCMFSKYSIFVSLHSPLPWVHRFHPFCTLLLNLCASSPTRAGSVKWQEFPLSAVPPRLVQ